MRRYLSIPAVLLLLIGCGDRQTPNPPGTVPKSASTPSKAGKAPDVVSSVTGSTPAPVSQTQNFSGRTGELVNPDKSTMVFLYYDLAGIAPPIDDWVEKDMRVLHAQPIDKAPRRVAVRAELEAGANAVRGVGVIRLSLGSAGLSDYDPTYGEFTVRALAPSSVVSFQSLGQNVSLQFGNARIAQIWRVPAAEAQAIRDKIANRGVSLDALLRIRAVQPGPGGGTITADVLEYEMRDSSHNGLTIGRVRVGPQ